MTVIKKIKGINNKIERNKDQCDLAKFQFYHQEMLVNINFWVKKML